MISQILAPLFAQLWWVIPLFLIVGTIKAFKPFLKGKVGELTVSTQAKRYLDKEKYTLLNDCTLPDEINKTTQIDHILLSPYGVFVIETKNYKVGFLVASVKKYGHKRFIKIAINFKIPCIKIINIKRF